jgi:hypothetical protein
VLDELEALLREAGGSFLAAERRRARKAVRG